MKLATEMTNPPRRIHEAFLPWVVSHANSVALSDDQRQLTYGELAEMVTAVANSLYSVGVRSGDRVLLVAENTVSLVVCILAISRLDAWSATVNARLSTREIDTFLDHSGARVAIYFNAISKEAAAHGLARGAKPLILPGIGEVLLGPLNKTAIQEPVFNDPAAQVAAMVYTSGTTGSPKAVMLTHANLLFIGANARKMRGVLPTDIIYGVLPLSHVYGLTALMIASLMSGSELRLVNRFQPQALARALAEEGITILHGAPAMYAKLLELSNGLPIPAPHLRVVQSGGAPLTLPLKENFERVFGLRLQNGYGMTEASPSICQTRMDAPRDDCSVGPMIPGIDLRLNEPDEAGVGELWVSGPNVMRGYYRDPGLTAETVTEDGWLRTGDLARIDADGAVFIVGRSKELIIRSGFNVYPIEVEQVLNAFPDVVQSAVVGREVDGNEEVVAFIEPSKGAVIDLDALADHLKQNLSPYKIPSEIIVLEQLPAAATGKVLKKELQRMALKPSTNF